MALRPKTARRVTLIIAAVLIVGIGGVAALTVPKWQRSRQIAKFERDGLAANEEGRHFEALTLLSRHVKGIGEANVRPEVFLALARSRAAVEAPRLAHLEPAATHYRSYLRLVPDDREAAEELTDVLVRAGRWGDAIDQAVRLRPEDISAVTPEGLALIRQELQARTALRASDPLIPRLEERLLTEEPPAFVDVWRAAIRRLQAGDAAGARAFAHAQADRVPGTTQANVLRALFLNRSDLEDPESNAPIVYLAADRLTQALGLEQAGAQADLSDVELVKAARNAFDAAGRSKRAIQLLQAAPATESDPAVRADLARRLYFVDRIDELLTLRPAADGRPVADVLGYQALAASERGDDERMNEAKRELQAIEYEFRAKSWLEAIAAIESRRGGNLPDARASLATAAERHALDPAIRVLQGDVYHDLLQHNDALASWQAASQVVAPAVWHEPLTRRASLLVDLRRGREAVEMLDQVLGLPAYADHEDTIRLLVRVTADRAFWQEASKAEVQRAIALAEFLIENRSPPATDRIRLDAARCKALRNGGEATPLLAEFLAAAPEPDLMTEARVVDWRHNLGAAEAAGIAPGLPADTLAAHASDLVTGYVSSNPNDPERIAAAASWLERGLAQATPEDRPDWLLAKAKFATICEPGSAVAAWRAAVEGAGDRTDILAQAVQSNVLGSDRAFVEATLSRIREITQTQGRELPGSLRLARAKAVFGVSSADEARIQRPGQPVTSQSRAEAIAIVRSVVAAEPRNLTARQLLAYMLASQPEHTSPDIRPDYAAAIEQLQAATQLVNGPKLVDLLYDIQSMAQSSGDLTLARQTLLRIVPASTDQLTTEQFITRLRESGDAAAAADLLNELMAEMNGPSRIEFGLMLAESYDALGQSEAAARVLDDLAGSDSLTPDQFSRIALGIAAAGDEDRSIAFIRDAERYGFSPVQQRYIEGVFQLRFGPVEAGESTLQSITVDEPDLVEAWIALADLYIRSQRSDEASELLARALARHPDDPTLDRLNGIVNGRTAEGLPALRREAFERVQRYEQQAETLSPQERVEFLRSLTADYPSLEAVQAFTLPLRLDLSEDPQQLARDARASAARFPNNAVIAGVAARATLLAGPPAEAIAPILRWRGLIQGSRQEADVYLAAAYLDSRDPSSARDAIEPHLDSAIAQPDSPLSGQTILLWARAQVRLGNQRAMITRLEPLLRSSESFRSRAWLDIVVSEAPDASTAAAWLDLAARDGGLDAHASRVASLWLRLSGRLERERASLLRRALDTASRALESDPRSLLAVQTRAEALSRLAELAPDEYETLNQQAADAYALAFKLDPNDLNLLFRAARSATEARDHDMAIQHYRTLLDRLESPDFFQAVVRNNLAMVLARATTDPARLAEAIDLAGRAIAFRNLGGFHGTRGWVRLAAGDAKTAVQDFRTAVEIDPGSTESWAGLAASLSASGANDAEVRSAFERYNTLRSGEPEQPWLSDALRRSGLTPAQSNPVP